VSEFVCEPFLWDSSHDLILCIATVLGNGKANASTTAKAQEIASKISPSVSIAELMNCGLTEMQAVLISASIHIGEKLCSAPLRPGEGFSNSREIFQRYRPRFYTARKEYFVALNLNSKNQLIREVLISVGSLSTSIVHPREVFAPAVKDSSAAILFMHNHPSGDPAPSREDRDCTSRLCEAGKILGIRVLDHIVIGYDDYYSFADAGAFLQSEPGI
jgi:DNA repair protein RadC